MSINKIILIGRLGKDPSLEYTAGGTAVCKFSVATTETWFDKNKTKQEETDWHNVKVFGKLAENCNTYLKKGSQVYIEGSSHNRKYEDKEGKDAYFYEIKAKVVNFLDAPQSNEDKQKEMAGENTSFSTTDIPF